MGPYSNAEVFFLAVYSLYFADWHWHCRNKLSIVVDTAQSNFEVSITQFSFLTFFYVCFFQFKDAVSWNLRCWFLMKTYLDPRLKRLKILKRLVGYFFFLHADSALSAMPMTPMSPAPQCHWQPTKNDSAWHGVNVWHCAHCTVLYWV